MNYQEHTPMLTSTNSKIRFFPVDQIITTLESCDKDFSHQVLEKLFFRAHKISMPTLARLLLFPTPEGLGWPSEKVFSVLVDSLGVDLDDVRRLLLRLEVEIRCEPYE